MKDVIALINANIGIPNLLVLICIAIYNYRRDRSRINVILRWDVHHYSEKTQDYINIAQIVVTNSGRQPIAVTNVALEICVEGKITTIVSRATADTILEGSPPKTYDYNQDALREIERCLTNWRNIRAVITVPGRTKPFKTKIPTHGDPPSWVIPTPDK